MAQSSRKLVWFFIGLVVGGLIGGIGGYVVNDLTSRENPEVVEEMRQDEQRQIDLDNALQQLGSEPAPMVNPDAGSPADADAGPSAPPQPNQ